METRPEGRAYVFAESMRVVLMPTFALLIAACLAADPVDVVVVIGAPGAEEYGEKFAEWAAHWEGAATKAQARLTIIGRDEAQEPADRERLQAFLSNHSTGDAELWLILIGHGTFDRREAKFNLRGPDVSANDLKAWLASVKRPVAVIDMSAASAPFLQTLAGPDRVVISATKSGGEQNFPYFGGYLSAAIVDPAADLDKDEQVSLWEAYLFASRRTEESYKTQGRLQTEHALLDDNGDGQGTRADAFQGLDAVQASADSKQSLDGDRAHQWRLVLSPAEAALSPEVRRRRDQLELQIVALKRQKLELAEKDYYARLEALLVQLATQMKRTPESQRADGAAAF